MSLGEFEVCLGIMCKNRDSLILLREDSTGDNCYINSIKKTTHKPDKSINLYIAARASYSLKKKLEAALYHALLASLSSDPKNFSMLSLILEELNQVT